MPRRGKPALWVCAALLLTARTAFCATPNAGEILRKVESFYSHLQNYHIVADQEDVSRYSAVFSSQHSTIILDAAGPERAHMSLNGKGLKVEVFRNGNTSWYYVPSQKMYLVREATPSAGGPGTQEDAASRSDLLGQMQDKLVGQFATISRFEKEAEVKGSVKVSYHGAKVPCYKVVLHLKDGTEQLWIDASSFRVLREEETGRQQGVAGTSAMTSTTIQISELAANPTRVAGFFTFRPPEGAIRAAALALPWLEHSYIGSTPEEFSLPDIEGREVSLSQYRGKTVLLCFWATWCVPCKAELPTLQKMYEQYRDKDLVILTVDDEGQGTIKDYLKARHFDFTALVDSRRTLFKRFAVHFVPTVFVINRKGIVTQELTGWEGPERIMAAVKAAEASDNAGGGVR